MGGSDRKEAKKLEVEIFDRFSKIAREKVLSALDDEDKVKKIDALYSGPEFSAEKKMLANMNNIGLMNGVLAGVACFAFLRWSPGAIARYLTRKRAASAGFTQPRGDANNPFNRTGYQFDQPPGEQAPLASPNFFIRGMRLGLDMFVSLSVGAWASVLLFDKDKMLREASEIPLVQGRSLLADELCQDFTVEFQKYSRDTWDSNHPALSGGNSNNGGKLQAFSSMVEGFVANCNRRSIYERELRAEQGLSEDDPVLIPAPGVPKDISVTLDDLMGDAIETSSSNDNGDGDFYFDKYFDEDSSFDGERKD
jgi:hypothetical protein